SSASPLHFSDTVVVVLLGLGVRQFGLGVPQLRAVASGPVARLRQFRPCHSGVLASPCAAGAMVWSPAGVVAAASAPVWVSVVVSSGTFRLLDVLKDSRRQGGWRSDVSRIGPKSNEDKTRPVALQRGA